MEKAQEKVQEKQKKEKKPSIPAYFAPRAPRIVKAVVGEAVLPKNEYFVEDGKKKAKVGKGIDLAPYLKASQASTDLASIVARLNAGDTTVINVRSDGMTGDFVGTPNSVNALGDLRKSLTKSYKALPEDVRKAFASEEEFYKACIDGTVKDKILNSKVSEKLTPKPDEEKPKVEEKPVESPSGKEEK